MKISCDRDDVLGARATSATAAGNRLLLRLVELDGKGNTALPTATWELVSWELTPDGVVMVFSEPPWSEVSS